MLDLLSGSCQFISPSCAHTHDVKDPSSSSPSSGTWRCLSFSSSTERWVFQLLHRDRAHSANCAEDQRSPGAFLDWLGHARRFASTGLDGPDSSVKGCRRCSSLGFRRPCDHAATFFSGTVEVPQIQFIACFGGHPSSQQRQVTQLGAMKGWRGVSAFLGHFSHSSGLSRS